jgi:hypothetical protein
MSTTNNPKPKQRHSLNTKEKQSIINVCEFIRNIKLYIKRNRCEQLIGLWKELGIGDVHHKVSKLFELSKSTVTNIVIDKENIENECHVPVQRRRNQSRVIECDTFTIGTIRRITHDFYSNRQFPTIETLLSKCLQDANFPRVKKTTFHKWMVSKCKFKHKSVNKKPVYLERPDIVISREKYLRDVRFYRSNNFHIFYTDETWTCPEQTKSRTWYMHLTNEERKDLEGFWNGRVLQDMDGWAGNEFQIRN